MLQPEPGPARCDLDSRHPVGGHLHDEAHRLPRQRLEGHPPEGEDQGEIQEIQDRGPLESDVLRHQTHDDDAPGGAGYQARGEGADKALPLGLHDPAAQGGGDAAAEPQHQGDEPLPVEPDPVHRGVHEKGDPREVARVLQDGEGEIERDDIREGDGGPGHQPLDQPVPHEGLDGPHSETRVVDGSQGTEEGLHEARHVVPEGEYAVEHSQDDGEHEGVPDDRVGGELHQQVSAPFLRLAMGRG